MITTLRHCLRVLPGLLLLLLLTATHSAHATHLLGGEMTYRYLDNNGPAAAPLRYEITVMVYNNCGNTNIRAAAAVGIYDQATGRQLVLTAVNYPSTVTSLSLQTGMMNIPQQSISGCTSPSIPPGCTISGVSQPYQLQKFVGVVNLPNTTTGYYALFTDGNRNVDITNLYMPSGQALTLYAALPPPTLPNRSPVFADVAVAFLCANDTTFLLNNAVDPDGDRLVYSFGQPYGTTGSNGQLPTTFLPPPPILIYNPGLGYTPTTPFGTAAGNYAYIDPSTGVAKYRASTVGRKYAVAIDVKEYRTVNGVEQLIGTTRRDLQLVVANCPPVASPLLATPAVMPRNYTIEAGSTLSIPVTATQADGHPLALTLNSELLDGAGGHDTSLDGDLGTVNGPTGVATVSGTNGTVAGTFVYKSTCDAARATPYDVALTVRDNGCAGKTVVDILHIRVVKPGGPTAIAGDLTVCGQLPTTRSYTASGGTAPKVSWRVVGGTIVGSRTANPVQVNWATTGTGTLVARGITQYGCLTDSVVQSVKIAPAVPLTVTGNLNVCLGSSTTLTAAGSTSYTVTGGATTLTGAGPFVVSPPQTTTYTITGAAVAGGCTPTTQVTVTVLPLPAANAGAARTICAGGSAQLGAAAVAGSTYKWSPTTGLSSTTAANPTVTLTNTTAASVTQTYTLTETNATGCSSTSTVAVTVNPVVVNTGAAVMLCSGGSAQLGVALVAGYTYSWSPSTGLSSSTVANPTLTLTNAGSAALAQTYTLTTTNPGGCLEITTVAVTVNPVVGGGTVSASQTVCIGSAPAPLTSTAGASGGTGTYDYQWESSFDNQTWAAVAGATSPTYAPGPISVLTYYRRRATSSSCATAFSNVVLMQLQTPLAAGVQLAAPPVQCQGSTFSFSPVPSNGGTSPTYRWFVNGKLAASSATFSSSTMADGDQVQVEMTPTVGFCASGLATATVTVHLTPVPPPAVTIRAQATAPVCDGSPATFSIDQTTNLGASTQYQWQIDNVNVPGAQAATFTSTALRDGQQVTLLLRTSTVCGSVAVTSNAVRAAIIPGVHLSAGPDKTIMEGERVVLEGQANGSYPVTWTSTVGLTFPGDQLHPVAAPAVTTTYTLAAQVGTCADQSTVTVTVTPRLRIPSAFSPNGDGDDDTWEIDHIGDYPSNRVLVYNRWGSKIYESAGYTHGNEWNGTISGQRAPIGTYYYVITLGNGKSYSGPLTVVY